MYFPHIQYSTFRTVLNQHGVVKCECLQHLRELLQALTLGAVLTLQAFKVSANLSKLQLQLGVAAAGVTQQHACLKGYIK